MGIGSRVGMQVLDGIKSEPSVSGVVADLAGVLIRPASKVPRQVWIHLCAVWTWTLSVCAKISSHSFRDLSCSSTGASFDPG